uniref:Uncharacterized protein n=1 Tax=Myotis lucifugus TaxID=59463 RepID=G1Q6H9_MYOLU
VSATSVEELRGMSLLVGPSSQGSLLSESNINPNTAYQKQQETGTVWSEAEHWDLALRFQEKAGGDGIWGETGYIQGSAPSVAVTQGLTDESEEERFEDMPEASPLADLPTCKPNKLEEIADSVASALSSPIRREKLALALENEGYIRKRLQLFQACETLENAEGSHHVHEIVRGILFLNKATLFEVMFSDACTIHVVGCLEYDPALAQPKRHREFLTKTAKFKKVMPITDSKVHQTYRIQHIQDIVLPMPSFFHFEENFLSALTSFIIVSMLQEDEEFLSFLAQLTHDGKLCELTLQPQNRDAFSKTLAKFRILPALEIVMGMDDFQVRSTAADKFSYLTEFSPSMARICHSKSPQSDHDILLINVVTEQMICDPDLGGAVQFMGLLCTRIDPENMLAATNKTEKKFLHFFPNHCMHVLTAPCLTKTSEDKREKNNIVGSNLLALISELLAFCVEHHAYHKNYIMNKDLLRRVLVLMNSKHTFLALCALRFMRQIIGLQDEFYNRYINKRNLFEPVVNALHALLYNLLNSAVIEFFAFVRMEDIKSSTARIVENSYKSLELIEYVQTFQGLKTNYEQEEDRQNQNLISVPSVLRSNRFADAKAWEEDEEMGFNEGEEEEGKVVLAPVEKSKPEDVMKNVKTKKAKKSEDKENRPRTTASGGFSFPFPSSASADGEAASRPVVAPTPPASANRASSKTTHLATSVTAPKGSLVGSVDYPEEEEEEEEEETPSRKTSS